VWDLTLREANWLLDAHAKRHEEAYRLAHFQASCQRAEKLKPFDKLFRTGRKAKPPVKRGWFGAFAESAKAYNARLKE
jgi:hypothetical protein